MSSNYTKSHQQQYLDANQILNFVYEQESYITNLNEFLTEEDTVKALIYWLSEYTDTQKLNTTNDINYIIQVSISEIDHLINDQLNHIIHNPKFQKLEASWRGLWFLSEQLDDAENVKIRVLDINWSEVSKDINRAIEFDQSHLFQKIYSNEFGIAGGEPFGVLIGDYEISHRVSEKHSHDDISTLEGMAEIAAAAFAPFIAGAAPELFGLDNFSGFGREINFNKIFKQTEYLKWNHLRSRSDTRFIGLTLPRILMRLPYRTTPGSYKGLFFYEQTTTSGNEHYLWGNACYGFASILIREFINVGWFGHIRGVQRDTVGGGLLTTVPVDCFKTDAKNISFKPLTDVVITDKQERIVSDFGFIPLCQNYDNPFASFYNNQSIHQIIYETNIETKVNSKLSAMLQHILCAARFAHYIKIMFRDKIGSFERARDVEYQIQSWLHKYTSTAENMSWEKQARYPLRASKVAVKEHPAKPGHFLCIIHLRPHYQLDQMVSELELATELSHAG